MRLAAKLLRVRSKVQSPSNSNPPPRNPPTPAVNTPASTHTQQQQQQPSPATATATASSLPKAAATAGAAAAAAKKPSRKGFGAARASVPAKQTSKSTSHPSPLDALAPSSAQLPGVSVVSSWEPYLATLPTDSPSLLCNFRSAKDVATLEYPPMAEVREGEWGEQIRMQLVATGWCWGAATAGGIPWDTTQMPPCSSDTHTALMYVSCCCCLICL